MEQRSPEDQRTFRPDAADALWNALTHDSGAAIFILSPEPRILFANHAAAWLCGRTPLDLLDAPLHDILPDAADRWALAVRLALQSDSPLADFEFIAGTLHRRTIRPINQAGTHDAALCICHPNPGEYPPPDAVVHGVCAGTHPLQHLTPREVTVLAMIGAGLRNHEIARRMSRSIRTVDGYCHALLRKLNARSRTHLAVFALRAGLVTPDGRPLDIRWNNTPQRHTYDPQ